MFWYSLHLIGQFGFSFFCNGKSNLKSTVLFLLKIRVPSWGRHHFSSFACPLREVSYPCFYLTGVLDAMVKSISTAFCPANTVKAIPLTCHSYRIVKLSIVQNAWFLLSYIATDQLCWHDYSKLRCHSYRRQVIDWPKCIAPVATATEQLCCCNYWWFMLRRLLTLPTLATDICIPD